MKSKHKLNCCRGILQRVELIERPSKCFVEHNNYMKRVKELLCFVEIVISQRSTVTVIDEKSCSVDASWRHRWLKHENDVGVARGAVATS